MALPPAGSLRCPSCRFPLLLDHESLSCPACSKTYPAGEGVVRLTEKGSSDEADATVRQFGESWRQHPHLADYFERQFLDWIAPLAPEDFRGKVVLEAGCGKGRHSRLVAGWVPERLFSVDLSSAVFLAARNTAEFPSVHCLQADLLDLPFENDFFDLVCCVGVLHHLESPERGLHELWRVLKPGGKLCLWVYAREGNGWIVSLVDPIRKGITSKIPTRILRPLLLPLSGLLYCALKAVYGPASSWGKRRRPYLPYSSYLAYISKFPFREVEHIVLDHLCPPIAFYLSRSTLEDWFRPLAPRSLAFRFHNGNSWGVLAGKGG